MVDWYLNRALTNFRREVNARWPNRDRQSDGTIGDLAHQQSNSSHNPDSDGSVDAWDMDVELNGVGESYANDVEKVKRAFEAHESSHYWIHNDQICFRSEGWKPRSYEYAGPERNRHTQHVHFNTRESHERSEKPFFQEDILPLKDDPDFVTLQKNVESIRHLVNVAGYRVEAVISNRSEYNDQMGNAKAVNRLSGALDGLSRAVESVSKRLTALEARLGTPGAPVTVRGAEVASALLAHPSFVPTVVKALNDDQAARMRE